MFRDRRFLVCCAAISLLNGAGCSHLMETRAIEQFAVSLDKQDLDKLRGSSSSEFADRALRTSEAMEDLKILNLPDGKTTVVEVEEVNDKRRRVTVQVGEKKREVFYELQKNSDGRWVVDEVYLRQKHQGVEVYKSVSEQMDLLLTVREFLTAWQGADREAALAATSETLRAELEKLPPSYLATLTSRVTSDRPKSGTQRPRASLDEKTAVVRLPRLDGETLLTLEMQDGEWKVTDIGVSTSNEEEVIPSVYKQALAVNACTKFLQAFEQEDKDALREMATPAFFEGSLAVGQLRRVSLPSPQLSEHRMKVKLQSSRADFILENDFQIVQLNMRREDAEQLDQPPRFSVADVTIYDMATRQEMRLSALFTAQAMLDIFSQSLSTRDLTHLRHSSTRDFSTRVWQQLDDESLESLPLTVFASPEYQVVETQFQGSLTRIVVDQGGQRLTYLMREEGGRFYVDDVLWTLPGRPESMKVTMELLVPVHRFASAIAAGRDASQQQTALTQLQRTCSADFNRMVWQQTSFVPNSGYSADTFLRSELTSVVQTDKHVTLQFGNAEFGARVQLAREYEHWAVDDIELIAGETTADRLGLKKTLRVALAEGQARPPAGYRRVDSEVIPAKAETIVEIPDKGDPFAEIGPIDNASETSRQPAESRAPRKVVHDTDVIPIPTQSETNPANSDRTTVDE